VNKSGEIVGKLAVDDSIRVNKSGEIVGKLSVDDSLHVYKRAEFTNASVDTVAFRRNVVVKKDGSSGSVILQNTGNIIEFNGATASNIVRASDAAGGFKIQTGGTTTRLTVNPTGETVIASWLQWHAGGAIASASTIALLVGNEFTITGTTTIQTITVPSAFTSAGYVIWLEIQGALTIKDGTGNLKLNGDFVGDGVGDDDMLELYCDGTNWFELTRSIN